MDAQQPTCPRGFKLIAILALLEGVIAALIAPSLLGISGVTEVTLLLSWYILGIIASFTTGYAVLRMRPWLRVPVLVWLAFNFTACYAIAAMLDIRSLYDDALAPTVGVGVIALVIALYVFSTYSRLVRR